MNAASLIRDTLKQDTARWHLQEYHIQQKDDHMDVGGRAKQEARAEKKKLID